MPNLQTTETDYKLIIDLWVVVYLTGLICSKALLSIGMIGFSLTALVYWINRSDKDLINIKVFLFPIILFVAVIFSGINSSNLSIWSDFLIKKLPFLILPFAFYSLRHHLANRYYDYLVGFVFIVSIVSLGVLSNYLMNFEALTAAIGKGKAITTPIDHTEFSIFVAFAAIVSLFLFLENRKVVRIGNRSTLFLLSIFLIIFLHILAVRSGLAVFYITTFFVGVYYFITQKKFLALSGLVAALVIFPVIAFMTIPSLKTKIGYVNWDLEKYRTGEGLNYSDSERLYSLRVGIDIFRENSIIGVGIGDLKDACQEKYMSYLGTTLNHYPHNQYLFALASMGVIGLVLYLLALLGPLVALRGFYDPYFLSLHGIIFTSALAENTLERSFSIGFYLFFVLTCICFLTRSWAPQK